jgi:hypothetical protein
LLLLREAERKTGVCRRLAEMMPDRRDPDRIRHEMFEMVMARSAAIACGHKDANDLERLRHDPGTRQVAGSRMRREHAESRLGRAEAWGREA